MVHLLRGFCVKVFEYSSHQVEASSDQDMDLSCIAERSSFSHDAGFHWKDNLGGVRQHWIPALSDPLEGAEDAGEHQGVCLLFRDQGQATFNEQLWTVAFPQTGVKTPASLVVQAAC